MNILQISPQFPFPLSDGGKISISNLTKALVEQGCSVHCVCLTTIAISRQQLQKYESYTGAICHPILHDTTNSLSAILQSIVDVHTPLYIRKHRSSQIVRHIENLCKTTSFDAIICDHTAMAEIGLLIAEQHGIPCILRMHNIEHIIWKRYAERLAWYDPRSLYVKSQAKKLCNKESEFCMKADYSAMITLHDVDVITALNHSVKATCIPVGVDLNHFIPQPTINRIPNRMIHATTYDWIHNTEALDWFIQEVLPNVYERHNAELHLYGKHMPDRYASESVPGLKGHGFIEDLNTAYAHAGIYIAPLFVGGGIRIKILEAMSAGLPVIASPIAAEGIEANREDGLIRCNNATEFVKEISQLIEQPEMAHSLGMKGRAYIAKYHSWESSAQSLIKIITDCRLIS